MFNWLQKHQALLSSVFLVWFVCFLTSFFTFHVYALTTLLRVTGKKKCFLWVFFFFLCARVPWDSTGEDPVACMCTVKT